MNLYWVTGSLDIPNQTKPVWYTHGRVQLLAWCAHDFDWLKCNNSTSEVNTMYHT